MNTKFILSFALAALSQAVSANTETHQISVTLAVDNKYTLFINGQSYAGPIDDGSGHGWTKARTFNRTVTGSGPWLVAVEALDYGVISGFIGAVYLDGHPYSASGVPNNLYRLTNAQPATGWNTAITFNDASWAKNISNNCVPQKGTWGAAWGTNFHKLTPGLTPQPMWYPACTTVHGKNFIRLIVDQNNLDCSSPSTAGAAVQLKAAAAAPSSTKAVTTTKPATTTIKPATTTIKRVTTTVKPATTTPAAVGAARITTTTKRVTTTVKPATNTPAAVGAARITTTTKRVTTTVKPTTTTRPAAVGAARVTTTTKRVTTTIKPTTTTRPAAVGAARVTTTTKRVTTTVKPASTTPAAVGAARITTTTKRVTTTVKSAIATAGAVAGKAAVPSTTAKATSTRKCRARKQV